MFGLEVTPRGGQPIHAALDQGSYLVNAGATWRRRRPTAKAELFFQASGSDDREDALLWLRPTAPAPGSWLDVAVVDTPVGSLPRAAPRKATDWDRFFEDQRARDLKQITRLEALIVRFAAGRAPKPREWPVAPPQLAFRVLVNGKEVCKPAVGDPGWLAVTVYARFKESKGSAQLSILGGDQQGPENFQGYEWKLKSRLTVGDRVRIALATPTRVSAREASRPELPPTRETLQLKLDELREQTASPDYYRENARTTRDYQRKRPPQRRYSR